MNSAALKIRHASVEEWEDWEDESIMTPIETDEQVLVQSTSIPRDTRRQSLGRSSVLRSSTTTRFKRLRSRHRQRTQNAKAGIKIMTDMSLFKRGNHVDSQDGWAEQKPVKFVDATALRALEGEPSSASVGSWNWLKKLRSPISDSGSPARPEYGVKNGQEDGPIVIGLSPPSDGSTRSSQNTRRPSTSFFGTYDALSPSSKPNVGRQKGVSPTQQHHLPTGPMIDTGARGLDFLPYFTETPSLYTSRVASSLYSPLTTPGKANHHQLPPPVPALPIDLRLVSGTRISSCCASVGNPEEDENMSPCTLFEEDGHKATMSRRLGVSPHSASSRSHGWWDHVVSPFLETRSSLSSRKFKAESPCAKDDVWVPCSKASSTCASAESFTMSAPFVQAPIVREPAPRRQASPRLQRQTVESSSHGSCWLVGPVAVAQEKQHGLPDIDGRPQKEEPPPYSPPPKICKKQGKTIGRFRAAFPAGHPLQMQFPPSPGPISPGLTANMISQGATPMTKMTASPVDAPRAMCPPGLETALPTRPAGSYLRRGHAHDARGCGREVERRRRRHEKEDMMARRAGGFWRGRGCIPSKGCMGRSGREGRKRRRVWIASCAGFMLLVALSIILGLVLGRRHRPADVGSIWVNLTDFPPMPTGVLTVVGPDNSVSKSVCTEPSSLWSCSLPKEQHAAVAPYRANQPTVVMEIQWDNGTMAGNGFHPMPEAPGVEELWFLGNTTDGIQRENKAGEVTPFYISLLKSEKERVERPTRDKRAPGKPTLGPKVGNESLVKLLPGADVDEDGTAAPAVMLPTPVHQAIRLYDRGLATEHYGFWTHFKRSIMVKSVKIGSKGHADDDKIKQDVAADQDGGCAKNEANYVVTWGETRVLVQIWTRRLQLKTGTLVRGGSEGDGEGGRRASVVRPGTMPYPVTVTLDTHGGKRFNKLVWDWPLDKQQRVDVHRPELLVNDMGVGGSWINPRGSGSDKMGGWDGGTGGCKCQWVNWVERSGDDVAKPQCTKGIVC